MILLERHLTSQQFVKSNEIFKQPHTTPIRMSNLLEGDGWLKLEALTQILC